MKMKVQLIIEDKSGSTATTEIATLERGESDELIGLSLEEAKAITASVQRTLLEAQAREAIDRGSTCTQCKARLRGNGAHRVIYRTAFGRLTLAIWLHGHMSPELQYLEAQFAAQLSYGMSARILGSVLPLQQATSITTWKRHVARVGGRLDEEAHQRPASHPVLNEFGLPTRNPLRAVGIDGGHVKASDAPSRQEGWFEVMVGKSLPRAGSGQVFAFVHRLEPKPNARMERFRAEQGVFPAQSTTFLSDGGETLRQAQGEFREFGEPIATGFVESAVNQVVSKRLVKKQQMRWTPNGAHRLLQVRTRVLNQQLRADFERWHPELRSTAERSRMPA
jgi:hypothetical protein